MAYTDHSSRDVMRDPLIQNLWVLDPCTRLLAPYLAHLGSRGAPACVGLTQAAACRPIHTAGCQRVNEAILHTSIGIGISVDNSYRSVWR